MPRSNRPRKAYRPTGTRTDAFLHAMDRASLLSTRQQAELIAPMQKALEEFRLGRGSAAYWADLADAVNVGEALAALRIGSNLVPYIEHAQAALASVHARHAAGGSWTLRGPELAALDDAVWAAGVQIQHCSQGEMQTAIDRVKRRMAAALAGNAAPGSVVCVGLLTDTPQTTTGPNAAHINTH
jgi:hypothetical protein